MKPRNRIIASLNKLIQDAKDAEANFDAKRAKHNLAAAIEQHGEWVQVSAIAAHHAAVMVEEIKEMNDTAFESRVKDYTEWFVSQIVLNRADRPSRLAELAAHQKGYEALTDYLS